MDPYHAVQAEIQTSLQAAGQLRASYVRIRNMVGAASDSEELVWARNELKATLAALSADLEDLDESVKVVEQRAGAFGLPAEEVRERRRYVERVRREVDAMREDLAGEVSGSSSPVPGRGGPSSPGPSRVNSPHAPMDDSQRAWAREEQQMLMREQDRTIDVIAGTLGSLAQQAGLMGHEIAEHNELLTDLESNIDRTETKLGTAMGRMKRFVRQTEESGSGWCVTILTIVLMVLLVVAIFV